MKSSGGLRQKTEQKAIATAKGGKDMALHVHKGKKTRIDRYRTGDLTGLGEVRL